GGSFPLGIGFWKSYFKLGAALHKTKNAPPVLILQEAHHKRRNMSDTTASSQPTFAAFRNRLGRQEACLGSAGGGFQQGRAGRAGAHAGSHPGQEWVAQLRRRTVGVRLE